MQHGIFPDLVVGTSAGALNGVWLAKDPTMDGVEKLKELWLSLKPRGPFQEGNLRVLMRLLLGRSYLFANKALRKLVCQYVEGDTFEDLEIPATVVSTNLETGEPAYFDQGLLEPAVLASTAIPGVFPAVKIEDVEYIDGAMMSNCSPAPEGHDHWTLRLLAGKAVELGLAPSLSHETVQLRLKKTRSSRGGNSNGASRR